MHKTYVKPSGFSTATINSLRNVLGIEALDTTALKKTDGVDIYTILYKYFYLAGGVDTTYLIPNYFVFQVDGDKHFIHIDSTASSLLDNLFAYYSMDGATAADTLGANNLTNSGAVAGASGKIKNAFSFDTNTDYLYRYYSTAPSSDYRTVNCWIYLNSLPSVTGRDFRIFYESTAAFAAKYLFFVDDADNKLKAYTYNTSGSLFSLSSSAALTTGSWIMVSVVMPNPDDTGILYINNSIADASQTPWSGTMRTSDYAYYVGGSPSSNAAIDGSIDLFGIWLRNLTSTEFTTLYNSASGVQYPF